MGVDFYSCRSCTEIFADYGDFTSCEGCGTIWCSCKCAEEEGYVEKSCALEIDMEDSCEKEKNEQCPKLDYCDEECKYCRAESCGHCREEIIDNDDLLNFTLEKLGLSKEELIEECKKIKGIFI